MSRLKYLFFLITACLIIFPFLIEDTVITKNDLNGNIVPLLHYKESLIEHFTFPQWNPYINQGIPQIADPLYGIYNPVIGIPILFFNYTTAIKLTYLISIFLGLVSMYHLLRFFNVNERISFLIALTYGSSSYVAARINAGHLEKVASFGLLPLFIYSLFKITKEKNILWSGITAIVLALILFSGDIYNTLYSLYISLVFLIFSLIRNKKAAAFIVLFLVLFFLFSSIKIFPMVELQQYISKIKEPFAGSQNALSIFYHLFLPFPEIFKIIIPVEYFLSNAFGWWESLTFIGPFALLGVFNSFNFIKRNSSDNLKILFLLSILFLILSTPGALLNPIRILIDNLPILQYFHVPSRILMYWAIVLLISYALLIQKFRYKRIGYIILFINLAIVFYHTQSVLLSQKFTSLNDKYENAINDISESDRKNYNLIHETSQGDIPQDQAYLSKTLLLQSNYGLFLKGSPGERYNFRGNDAYSDIQPGFILSDKELSRKNFSLERSYDNSVFLYKNTQATPFANLGDNIISANIGINKISVKTSSKEKGTLTLLESSYPGWKVYEDNKEVRLTSGRFLSVNTNPGEHNYEFRFNSYSFYLGAFISAISLLIWIRFAYKFISRPL